MIKVCRFIFSFLMLSPANAAPIAEGPEKGWLWYKEEKNQPKIKEKKSSTKLRAEKPLTANEKVKAMREEFEEILALAVLHPTLENVMQAKNKQLEFEERSKLFSDVWVLAHILDSKGYSHGGNPHPWHQEISHKERETKMEQKLKKISKSHGLFFAFKESCPYCHKFAPVVASFASQYEFEIKGISADGGIVDGIQNISKDNGALAIINPDGIYPALYLANPKTMEVIPIAWGMVTMDQLLNNLEAVLQQTELRL